MMMTVMHLCYHGCLCCRILLYIKYIFMLIYITHRIFFSGFYWIKVITWYRADDGSQTISAIRFGIRRPILLRRNEGQVTSKRSSSTSNRSWKTNESFSQELVTEKWKQLVDNSAQTNTKKSTSYAGAMYLRLPLLFFLLRMIPKSAGQILLYRPRPKV